MKFHVYLIISKNINKFVTYVGYTNNIKKRLSLHNSSKGAKFTKGKKWELIYYVKYDSKSDAMKEEYKLKKNFGKKIDQQMCYLFLFITKKN